MLGTVNGFEGLEGLEGLGGLRELKGVGGTGEIGWMESQCTSVATSAQFVR